MRASEALHEICHMDLDDKTLKSGVMWGLRQSIEGFPDHLISASREFVGCIDVDEDLSPGNENLRCTLFLFTDYLLIAKRPTGSKTGGQLVGLDDPHELVAQQTQALLARQPINSPRRRRPQLRFRGLVPLESTTVVDFGGAAFGLHFAEPPADSQSERWCGRPSRKYIVASTYASDVRRPEKQHFIDSLATSLCVRRTTSSGPAPQMPAKSAVLFDNGSRGDSTRVYWTMGTREAYEVRSKLLRERKDAVNKNTLALHLDINGRAPDIEFDATGPQAVARANFVAPDLWDLSVRFASGEVLDAERISASRIMYTIVELGFSQDLDRFQTFLSRPGTPSTSEKLRPRSWLREKLGVTSDLQRGQSNASRVSNTTTTSRYTQMSTSSLSTPRGTHRLSMLTSSPEQAMSPQHHALNLHSHTRSELDLRSARAMSASEDIEILQQNEDDLPQSLRDCRRRRSSLPPALGQRPTASEELRGPKTSPAPQPPTPTRPLFSGAPRRMRGPREMSRSPVPSPQVPPTDHTMEDLMPRPESRTSHGSASKRPSAETPEPLERPPKKFAAVEDAQGSPTRGQSPDETRLPSGGAFSSRGRRTPSGATVRESTPPAERTPVARSRSHQPVRAVVRPDADWN